MRLTKLTLFLAIVFFAGIIQTSAQEKSKLKLNHDGSGYWEYDLVLGAKMTADMKKSKAKAGSSKKK